jgi:alkyl hydroperoxide reductase subunit AhpC/predicted Ser/Thr protein kinase
MTIAQATVGFRAPAFDLPCTRLVEPPRERVALDDYQGRWLTLVFYPRDFSMVCPTELTALSRRLEDFHRRDCDLLGISTDSVETHERWIIAPRNQGGLGGLSFPLASDLEGTVCKAYGVYVPRQNVALRGLFIIDPNGVLQYQVVHNLSVGRRSEEVLRVLDGLQTGGLCPENWSRDEPTLDPSATLGPNSVVGNYRIEAPLGAGSFASVFRARDLTLERTVAVKIIRPGQPKHDEALLREARAAAALNHPNVCTLYSVDASDGLSMIVMEFVDGEPLNKVMERGPLELGRARALARQVALGMAAAHEQGVVHGDLKPANIMITRDNVVKITDFGLARRISGRAAATNAETAEWKAESSSGIFGTPSYMSPEQVRGDPTTPASDVFALGLILFEMVTGQRAIHEKSIFATLRKIEEVNGETLAAALPTPFREIIGQVLRTASAQRSLSMAAIAKLL